MNLVALHQYKMYYIQKAWAWLCPHHVTLIYCKLCLIDTLNSDLLCCSLISSYGQFFLKPSINIEALRLNNSGFYDFWYQKDAHQNIAFGVVERPDEFWFIEIPT